MYGSRWTNNDAVIWNVPAQAKVNVKKTSGTSVQNEILRKKRTSETKQQHKDNA